MERVGKKRVKAEKTGTAAVSLTKTIHGVPIRGRFVRKIRGRGPTPKSGAMRVPVPHLMNLIEPQIA